MGDQRLNGALRRRRNGVEGARLVAEYERSGLGRKEFCAAHGLSVHTLDAWRRRVASSRSEDQMVPVEIVTETAVRKSSRPGTADRPGQIRIVFSDGLRVEVDPGFDANELRRVIAVLDHADWPDFLKRAV